MLVMKMALTYAISRLYLRYYLKFLPNVLCFFGNLMNEGDLIFTPFWYMHCYTTMWVLQYTNTFYNYFSLLYK